MRTKYAALAAGIAVAFSQAAAAAQDMVYTPIDPTFGGNPFNSAHILAIANGQNKFKDPSYEQVWPTAG